MKSDTIVRFLNARPFEPFIVNLADGRSFSVSHPEFASISKGGRTLMVSDHDENVEWMDTMLITSLTKASGQTTPNEE